MKKRSASVIQLKRKQGSYVLQDSITRVSAILNKPIINIKLSEIKREYLRDSTPNSLHLSTQQNSRSGSPVPKSLKSAKDLNIKVFPTLVKSTEDSKRSSPFYQERETRRIGPDVIRQRKPTPYQINTKMDDRIKQQTNIQRTGTIDLTINSNEKSCTNQKSRKKISLKLLSRESQAGGKRSSPNYLGDADLYSLDVSKSIFPRSNSQSESIKKKKSIDNGIATAKTMQSQLINLIREGKEGIPKLYKDISQKIHKKEEDEFAKLSFENKWVLEKLGMPPEIDFAKLYVCTRGGFGFYKRKFLRKDMEV